MHIFKQALLSVSGIVWLFCPPWILCSQFFLGGEQLNAVLQLEKRLLLWFVFHTLVLVKVLWEVQVQ